MSIVALSELLGATVRDASGPVRGRVREIAVAPQDHPTRVAFLIVRTPEGERMLPAGAVKSCGATVRATSDAARWEPYAVSDGVLLLKRDLLDQQIIDVHGRKVVRVNDVELYSNADQQPPRARRPRGRRRRARRDPSAGQRPRAVVHAARAARKDSAARHSLAVRRPARDRSGAAGETEDRLRRALEDASRRHRGHRRRPAAGRTEGGVRNARRRSRRRGARGNRPGRPGVDRRVARQQPRRGHRRGDGSRRGGRPAWRSARKTARAKFSRRCSRRSGRRLRSSSSSASTPRPDA